MKRTFFVVLVTLFALFLTINRIEAQTGSGLDTLTQVNGWRLVEYAPGVTLAKTWFVNDPFHGKFSQFFEVNRNSPNVANDREYYAIFKKNLKTRIKRSNYLQYSFKYSHSKPNLGVESPLLDIAFENNGTKTNLKNIVNIDRDIWTTYPISINDIGVDSVDCIYLRISGNFKITVVQIDYLVFADLPLNGITSVIEDFEDSTITDVKDKFTIPISYYLSQNYPNPFNPSTTITFHLSKSSFVTLKVFDVLGREVATLVNEEKSVGEHSVQFNASHLSSGMYIYQINIGNGQFVQTKKMILMK
ncbi:MAG: 5'-nucleotidase [Parcubacteria group bacterium LiPW_41]|nr:MAG: 5'-nucleotidase [Parcubacteria group bacterium LiPW_41]